MKGGISCLVNLVEISLEQNVIFVFAVTSLVRQLAPRLNVYRSLSNIYAQVIDDVAGTTLVAASSLDKDLNLSYGGNVAAAKAVGEAVAKKSYR